MTPVIHRITLQKFKSYHYPNIGCRESSAWHHWEKQGAIYAHEYGIQAAEDMAEDWASVNHKAMLQAFRSGIRNVKYLKQLKEN